MFRLFNTEKDLEKRITALEELNKDLEARRDELNTSLDTMTIDKRHASDELAKTKSRHERELSTIKHDRKIADEDIRHMVKIKEESLELAHDRKVVELERTKAEAIAVVKDKYRDKMETQLNKQAADLKEMYGQILTRLPDVNVMLGNQVKKDGDDG